MINLVQLCYDNLFSKIDEVDVFDATIHQSNLTGYSQLPLLVTKKLLGY